MASSSSFHFRNSLPIPETFICKCGAIYSSFVCFVKHFMILMRYTAVYSSIGTYDLIIFKYFLLFFSLTSFDLARDLRLVPLLEGPHAASDLAAPLVYQDGLAGRTCREKKSISESIQYPRLANAINCPLVRVSCEFVINDFGQSEREGGNRRGS